MHVDTIANLKSYVLVTGRKKGAEFTYMRIQSFSCNRLQKVARNDPNESKEMQLDMEAMSSIKVFF